MKTEVSRDKSKEPVRFPRLVSNSQTGSIGIQVSAEKIVMIHCSSDLLGTVVTTGISFWNPFEGTITISS